jgi:hypothetical protein
MVTYTKHLATCLTGSNTFTNPSPTPATLHALADALLAANVKAKSRGPGAVAERKAVWRQVEATIDEVVIYVRGVVRTQAPDPATATAMILGTGLAVKKFATFAKPALAAKHGDVSSEVWLVARTVAPVALYYWEYSADETSWSSVPATMQASTSISGLIPGQIYYFRFRAHTRKGMGDYSDVVRLMVL